MIRPALEGTNFKWLDTPTKIRRHKLLLQTYLVETRELEIDCAVFSEGREGKAATRM